MGRCRVAHDHGGALLRGTGDDDATGGRGLCFLARSVRTSAWIFIWLDPVSGRADRNDRGCCDRICEVSGVFAPSIAGDHYLIAPIVLLPGYAISLSTEQLVAILLIALLTFSNTRGLRVGKIVQNSFTFTKTAALIGAIILGLIFGWKPNCAALASHWWNAVANGWSAGAVQPGLPVVGGLAVALLFGKAMVGPLFAQTAWTNVTFIGSEVREPERDFRALLYGCGIVVVLYVLANVAYIASLPLTEIQNAPQNRVALAMMRAIFGTPGVLAMAAAIMISTFGCNNGLILAGARVYYAMARDNIFSKVGTTKSLPCAGVCAAGAGDLDSVSHFAAHRYD